MGVDVSKEEDVKEAVSKIRTRFNRVDVLVNTAGIL
ncbi:MAG: SDR family NAD(P)-dependent oxidoreductase [Mediterraneibacter gnavus]